MPKPSLPPSRRPPLPAWPLAAVLMAAVALGSAPAGWAQTADDYSGQELRELLRTKIRVVETFALSPLLIDAVSEQNAKKMTPADVQQRDRQWQESPQMTPLKLALQRNKAGRFLQRSVDNNRMLTAAVQTDKLGANVAAYPATSDYWQGDEEQWAAAYNDGSGQVYVSPVGPGDGSKTRQVQIAAPVIDRGETIGVLIMGVSADYLAQRRAQAE